MLSTLAGGCFECSGTVIEPVLDDGQDRVRDYRRWTQGLSDRYYKASLQVSHDSGRNWRTISMRSGENIGHVQAHRLRGRQILIEIGGTYRLISVDRDLGLDLDSPTPPPVAREALLWVMQHDERNKVRAAIALGRLGAREALPVLDEYLAGERTVPPRTEVCAARAKLDPTFVCPEPWARTMLARMPGQPVAVVILRRTKPSARYRAILDADGATLSLGEGEGDADGAAATYLAGEAPSYVFALLLDKKLRVLLSRPGDRVSACTSTSCSSDGDCRDVRDENGDTGKSSCRSEHCVPCFDAALPSAWRWSVSEVSFDGLVSRAADTQAALWLAALASAPLELRVSAAIALQDYRPAERAREVLDGVIDAVAAAGGGEHLAALCSARARLSTRIPAPCRKLRPARRKR